MAGKIAIFFPLRLHTRRAYELLLHLRDVHYMNRLDNILVCLSADTAFVFRVVCGVTF